MIDRGALLTDLQTLLRTLEQDLLERSASAEVPEVPAALRAEFETAQKAQRTAQNYEDWRSDAITQVAAAWVLSCVFVRFLEDNELIDPPRIAGPTLPPLPLGEGRGEGLRTSRLERARDEHTLFFQDRERATQTDREYLLHVFQTLGKLPGAKEVFGEHNLVWQKPDWLGPDAAGELLKFFQKIESDTGTLIHDFTASPIALGEGRVRDYDTRFLGDLYQDLSEAARKKYALLQTPEFVEEFILDRTLEPALDEFGLVVSGQRSIVSHPPQETTDQGPPTTDLFRMIDPACGSGHFLLGAFPRILNRWQKQEPGTNVRMLVQRTLNSIYGVDVNPYAVAIARFRLLLAALAACNVRRLADAPAFGINLACGDSLYHGRQRQRQLGDWTDEAHYFQTEDGPALRHILREGTYHVVVANPPYITPKDRAANDTYRKLYTSCHRQYSLAVPFMERIFRLALSPSPAPPGEGRGEGLSAAGYTGQITANSFMKREFGTKLVEEFLPTVDLSHVIDTSLAYIPGHGTPTVIILGRMRRPISQSIRTVMGIKREDNQPPNPELGQVWLAIEELVDKPHSPNAFVTVVDSCREVFGKHPWTLGGGGAADLKARLDSARTKKLADVVELPIGRAVRVAEEDAFIFNQARRMNSKCPIAEFREYLIGEVIRDWSIGFDSWVWYPYAESSNGSDQIRQLWPWRTRLANRSTFQGKMVDAGREWWEYMQHTASAYTSRLSIAFAFMVTHNQFVLDRGNRVFQQSAPVVKLAPGASEADHLKLLGLLNSSTGCFWMKNVFYDKGGGGIGGGIAAEAWERFMSMDGTKLQEFPIPENLPSTLTQRLDRYACNLTDHTATAALRRWNNSFDRKDRVHSVLSHAKTASNQMRGEMIWLQDELDWQCYQLYGLIDEDLCCSASIAPRLQLGQRAFEIVLARKMARGEVQTTWFARHGSSPITKLPAEWPDDYRRIVQRRIEVIESNPNIALIEQPEYKRRWNSEPWEEQVEKALRGWLLDRLESYFDFDGRMVEIAEWGERKDEALAPALSQGERGQKPSLAEIALVSVARLAEVAGQDTEFHEVGALLRDDPAFDVYRLVAELVAAESVPLLPVLRYKPSGLRKRAEWERTWELQRLEDGLRAGETFDLADYDLTDKQRQALTTRLADTPAEQRADSRDLHKALSIPVPPKYTSADFISSGGARYWSLRGKLDVPKERWISFSHCEGPDGTLMICWAGYDHLQQARAISAYYVEVQERHGGRDDPRLLPLLACLIELLPWLKQWHNEPDPSFDGLRMGDYFEGFVGEEARQMGKTVAELRAWTPTKRPRQTR